MPAALHVQPEQPRQQAQKTIKTQSLNRNRFTVIFTWCVRVFQDQRAVSAVPSRYHGPGDSERHASPGATAESHGHQQAALIGQSDDLTHLQSVRRMALFFTLCAERAAG